MKIAFTNAKAGGSPLGLGARTHQGKPLAPAAERITWAIQRFNQDRVTVCGFVEYSVLQAKRIEERHTRWDQHRTVNVRRHGGKVQIGNGVAWRKKVWREISREVITVPKVRSNYNPKVLDLHFPVVTLEHRRTGEVVHFIVVHFPAGKRPLIWSAKIKCARALIDYVRYLDGPVVIMGDFNAVHGLGLLTRLRGVRSTVDHIRVLNARVIGADIYRDFRNRITDHAAGISLTIAT